MQFIKQDYRISKDATNKLLEEFGRTKVDMNSVAIRDDIDRLGRDMKQYDFDKYVKNCKAIIAYLKKLLALTKDGGELEIEFQHNGEYIESSPIEVRKFKDFNIQTTDYFDLKSKSVITLDYSSLLDGIALEIGYYDLGFNMEEIEDKLKEVGIVANYDIDVLGDIYERGLYGQLYGMRVDDTPYLSVNGKDMHDYYGEKHKGNKVYKNILDSTAKKTMGIIVHDILTEAKNIGAVGCKIELVGVYDDSLVILVDKECSEDSEIVNKLAQPQVVRMFGRKFLFKPDVQIY